jgi:hypothetical protein
LSGVEVALLKAFLKLCSTGDTVVPLVDTEALTMIPVILATDGMALKAGAQEDPVSGEFVGLNQTIDRKFIEDHPNPSPRLIKSMLLVEADQMMIGTLDGRVALPVGTDYSGRAKTKEGKADLVMQRARQLQVCLHCLTDKKVTSDKGVITGSGDACSSACDGETACGYLVAGINDVDFVQTV